MPCLLVVDDEEVLRETLVYHLELAGYQVLVAGDGPAALAMTRSVLPDLIILDRMLPGMDGLEVCTRLRRDPETARTPILMVTALSEEVDKVVGLEVGADDYLTKPFSVREFLARVRALLRRSPGPATAPQDGQSETASPPTFSPTNRFLEAGPIRVDVSGRRVFRRGQEVLLQPKQFDLLVCFLRHRGIVLSRDALLMQVWGYEYTGDTRTVDVHIRWLREKLEDDPSTPTLLQTVRGVGYCWR